jgi:hypothetical protein
MGIDQETRMEQPDNPEISPQSPSLSEPMPAQVIEYYSNQNSALVLVQKITKIAGLLAIFMPISWMMMMFAVNDHSPMRSKDFGKAICIISGLADVPMIIMGIFMMLRYDRATPLFVLSWVTLILSWISFALLIGDVGSSGNFIVVGLIGGIALSLSIGFFTINGLLRSLRSIPEYKSYMR